jgi:hypothetical protein
MCLHFRLKTTFVLIFMSGNTHAYDITVYNNCPYNLQVQAGRNRSDPLVLRAPQGLSFPG